MTLPSPTAATRAAVLAALMVVLLAAPSDAQSTAEIIQRASNLAYDLDYDESVRLLRETVASHPNDPDAHRALASTLWLEILFQRGAVTVDYYLGGFTRSHADLPKPAPALAAEFQKEVQRAIALAEAHVDASPSDADAHYSLGAALGLDATYTASVEGKLMAGFRAAHRCYDEGEKALELAPTRKDAMLLVGTYRYIVSTLSLPMRLMAYVVGFGGGKEKGISMMEQAATAPSDVRPDALFALVLIYNREKRYDDALRALKQLTDMYTHNRLIVLEIGGTSLRAKRYADAEAALSRGLQMFEQDSRPKIPGESELWHLKRGAARVALGEDDRAATDLEVALGGSAAHWIKGRAHVQLGKLALRRGDEDTARRQSRMAIALCEQGHDPTCVDEAKRLR